MTQSNGKTVVVTGSARGIGYEIALVLGQEGYSVVLSDVNAEGLEKSRQAMENQGISVLAVAANVSKADDADHLIEESEKWKGRLDVVVNNAGITRDGLIMKMTEEAWDAVLNVNLKGTFLVSRAASRFMVKQKSGVVINIASVIGLMGNSGQSNYAASKAGIIAFTRSFAKEYARRGVRANAIAPGFIQTGMTDVLPEKVKEQMLGQIPLGSLGTPRDVANLVSFLASDKASYITGQVIPVDGGMVMY
ncbi:3-oxoacyl-[acyl-carrier-protein] reductase [bacterium CG2_30_54_10]|nr:MAG: 3-oxoacyl-[acyl-carrier-protein] reductase [bacterium CG2_30_54_10]